MPTNKMTLKRSQAIKGRRLAESDIQAILEMTAKGLNETEACLQIGIKPHAWFNWKVDNKDKYQDTFTRIRGNRISHLLEQVDKAANGRDGIRHDWRASQWLLSVSAPERFAQREQTASTNAPAIALDVLSSLASLVYGQGKPVQDVEVITRPELPEKASNG